MNPVLPASAPMSGASGGYFPGSREFLMASALHVLVVDDELLIRWSVSETLSAAGHCVVQASDGRSAIDALTSMADIDVVLLDYRLPDSDDLALLGRIRHAAPDAAVVMMTAYGTPEMIDDALALGAQAVITKPFHMHDLPGVVCDAHAWRLH
jgi:DNA-binding NtrC family response regulator